MKNKIIMITILCVAAVVFLSGCRSWERFDRILHIVFVVVFLSGCHLHKDSVTKTETLSENVTEEKQTTEESMTEKPMAEEQTKPQEVP